MSVAAHALAPSGWDAVVADLEGESRALAGVLQQHQVSTPGAAGLLNRLSRSTVWVHGPVDVARLLDELEACAPVPDLQVAEHLDLDADLLRARGWADGGTLHRLRIDLPPVPGGVVEGRCARPCDLPGLRALHARAFGDAEAYLPDLLLAMPDLQLRLIDGPDGRPVSACGVRLRHRGAFVFGLATLPEAQGQGLATAVLRGCLRWAAGCGAPFALADVVGPVPVLWGRTGFVPSGRWTRWTGDARVH